MQKKILLVEDDKEISELVTSNLEQDNYTVVSIFDGEKALQIFEKESFDLILLDTLERRWEFLGQGGIESPPDSHF